MYQFNRRTGIFEIHEKGTCTFEVKKDFVESIVVSFALDLLQSRANKDERAEWRLTIGKHRRFKKSRNIFTCVIRTGRSYCQGAWRNYRKQSNSYRGTSRGDDCSALEFHSPFFSSGWHFSGEKKNPSPITQVGNKIASHWNAYSCEIIRVHEGCRENSCSRTDR